MMKTTTTLCLAAALLLASCAKDEVYNANIPNADAIGIDVSTGRTRASVVGLDVLKAAQEGFGVYATSGASETKLINNKAYKYDGEWKWAETNIMWPKEDAGYPINFYAYYPLASATLNSSLSAAYTVAATPAAQEDLLAANQLNVVTRPASSNVNLAFKHILSKIDFKVVTGSAVTVEVQSAAVKNVGESGTFGFTNLAWTAAPTVWNSAYNYMTAPLNSSNKFEGATTATNVTGSDGSLMLMPQDLSDRAWDKTLPNLASQSYIEVVYRIYETATGKDIVGYTDATQHPDNDGSVTGSLFVKVAYSLPTSWLMGKAYTYTIHLGTADDSGGNLIKENFIDDNGDDTDFPVVDPDTEEIVDITDPIFPDKPIGFVVSVDDWADAEDTPLK